MAQIRVHQLHKAFADFAAVRDSSFTVEDGEFFCLLGPSGCGKTTTLRMIAGLELPTSGQIFLGDEDVSFKRASARDIAFVFQMFALYPHMTVRQNIAFPLVSQGMPRAEIDRRVMEAARTLRITDLLGSSVSGLSSGDRQRVALGRAIVRQPLAFLMDEPLGALDAEFREVMCLELRALHDRLGATTVYVTHDQTEAMAMADTIAVMNNGLIEQLGAPMDMYERPASVFVADFIGSPAMNFLELPLARDDDSVRALLGSAALTVPAGIAAQLVGCQQVTLGLRPEHLHLGSQAGDALALAAEVGEIEFTGAQSQVSLLTAAGALLLSAADRPALKAGDMTTLGLPAQRLHFFDTDTGLRLVDGG